MELETIDKSQIKSIKHLGFTTIDEYTPLEVVHKWLRDYKNTFIHIDYFYRIKLYKIEICKHNKVIPVGLRKSYEEALSIGIDSAVKYLHEEILEFARNCG